MNDTGVPIPGILLVFYVSPIPPKPDEPPVLFASAVTAADGTASAQLTLGSTPGQYQIMVFCRLNTCGQRDPTAPVFIETATARGPQINVTNVTMFDAHTLQVDVTGQFSQDASTQKFFQVSTTLSGVPLTSTFPLPSNAVGSQAKSLFFDLATNSVPRFTDNHTFDVTATATETGAPPATITKTGNEIPLPVVHVHGILADCHGSPPTNLFNYLQQQHSSYQADPGTGRFTATPFSQPYPTLVSFPYSSLNQSANSFAVDLGAWIRNDVLPSTWAAKVNIVAHSLGGIIARDAVWVGNASDIINRVVLVGSPAEGATVAPYAWNPASWLVLKTLNIIGTPLAVAMTQNLVTGYGLSQNEAISYMQTLASIGGCISVGNSQSAAELLPTYRWWASTKTEAHFGGGFLILPTAYGNPLSPTLNRLGLNSQIRYYTVVASGFPTLARGYGRTFLQTLLTPLGGLVDGYLGSELTDHDMTEPGDLIVPLKSQLATCSGWIVGVGKGALNTTRPDGSLRDIGRVTHIGYFDSGSLALPDINQILWRTDDNVPGQGSPMPRDSTCF